MTTADSVAATPDPPIILPMGALPAFWANQCPEQAAVVHGADVTTWNSFAHLVASLAGGLSSSGVSAGQLVTVALPNGPPFLALTFAIWALGATPNVVSAKLPELELREIIRLVNPALVVGLESERLPGWPVRSISELLAASEPFDPSESRVAPFWKAMTSGGSTGRPKVIVDHLAAEWSPGTEMFAQKAGEVMLNAGPLYHNGPFFSTMICLFNGGTVISLERFDAETVLRKIQEHRVTWINLVPTMMQRIMRLPEDVRSSFDLSSLRIVIHMAAACPPWLKEAWIDWLGPDRVLEVYAATERQGATMITGREWLARRGSVGRVQPGARLKIMGEDGQDVLPGNVGEIHFLPDAGPGSTYHYIGAEPRRRGEWDSPGDLGWLDEDGYLFLADRRTDLIVSGGANIYPAEVETALDSHPSVRSAVALGLPDEDLGQRVHAVVELEPEAQADDAELLAHLADRLVRYKHPRSFEYVTEPLRDDAGKVRRSQLRAQRVT